jgi:hypothetical protein
VVTSEGEQDDVDGREIHSRSGGSEHVDDQDEGNGPEMASRQDLAYARRLRRRAESLEYVSTSMLEQPPRVIPLPQDEPIALVSTLVQFRSPLPTDNTAAITSVCNAIACQEANPPEWRSV